MTTAVPVADLTHALDLAGVGANALLGGVKARERRFDVVGFVALAIVCGLGGGIIRDTLLQHGPPLALIYPSYLLTAIGGALVAYFVNLKGWLWEHSYRLVDAVALGCWAAAGAERTLEVGLGWLPAVLLGTVTAVAGGVMRDLLLREVPQIFGGNTLYATCATIASVALVIGAYTGHSTAGTIGAVIVGAGLCLLSYRRGWTLPRKDA